MIFVMGFTFNFLTSGIAAILAAIQGFFSKKCPCQIHDKLFCKVEKVILCSCIKDLTGFVVMEKKSNEQEG